MVTCYVLVFQSNFSYTDISPVNQFDQAVAGRRKEREISFRQRVEVKEVRFHKMYQKANSENLHRTN